VQESPDAKEFDYRKGSIEFKNVSFGHKREDKGGFDTLKNADD